MERMMKIMAAIDGAKLAIGLELKIYSTDHMMTYAITTGR
jgi:hypothetical protein